MPTNTLEPLCAPVEAKMTVLRGACHCGHVEAKFETSIPVEEIAVRACGCSFCRRHGAKTVADPRGRVTFFAPPDGIERYRFGLRTADYLICRTCGVYAGAVIGAGEKLRGTLNVAGTAIEGLCDRPAQPVEYDLEDADQRRARRLAHWTPAEILLPAAQAGGG